MDPVTVSDCAATAAQPSRDPRVADAVAQAQRQHVLFGGQLINRAGGIVKVGFHEGEFDRLPGETTPTWQRVAGFWNALERELPASFRSPDGGLVRIRELLERIDGGHDGSMDGGLDPRQRRAVESAFLRSALIDQPWSAAFISFLMKTAGFGAGEFAFSDSHVDYVDQAVLASDTEARGGATDYAYRACDIATTPPRPGDLICHTRAGSSGIDQHADFLQRLAHRRLLPWRMSFPMHCDIVTRAGADDDAGLEAIGGNVFQSVTLRQMTLDERKILSRAYFPSDAPRSECTVVDDDCADNLNRRPWVVLLQVRH
jgi:hypothetical protein